MSSRIDKLITTMESEAPRLAEWEAFRVVDFIFVGIPLAGAVLGALILLTGRPLRFREHASTALIGGLISTLFIGVFVYQSREVRVGEVERVRAEICEGFYSLSPEEATDEVWRAAGQFGCLRE